jgi:hypothetical protein
MTVTSTFLAAEGLASVQFHMYTSHLRAPWISGPVSSTV